MGFYSTSVTNQFGLPIANCLVTVVAYDGSLATLTNFDNTPLANPFLTDDLGDVAFQATDGQYSIEYREGGRLVLRDNNVNIGSLIIAVNPDPTHAGYYIGLDADGNPAYLTGGGGGGGDLTAYKALIASNAGAANVGTSSGTTVQVSLDSKATTSALTSGLALKANITDVNTALALKADTATVNTALALKADTTTVNSALALKASLAQLAATGGAALIGKTGGGTVQDFINSGGGGGGADPGVLASATPVGAYNAIGLPTPQYTFNSSGFTTPNISSTYMTQAVADTVGKYYDVTNGRLYGPSGGIAFNPTQRPYLWQMEGAHNVLYWDWRVAASSAKVTRITNNYNAHRTIFGGDTNLQLATILGDVGGIDDGGWKALWMLQAYQVTGDAQALLNAAALVTDVRTRFADPNNAGSPYGLWYRITASGTDIQGVPISVTAFKRSVGYETTLAIVAMGLYTANPTTYAGMLTYAQNTWSWMQTKLKDTTRGIYYRELELDPSTGAAYLQPHTDGLTVSPGRAYSYHFILGTCGMAVLSGLLYNATGTSSYLAEAVSIIDAMPQTNAFLRPGNVFLSDADGWENGFLFPYVASVVLPLPGVDTSGKFKQTLINTAAAIARRRTDSTYFHNGTNFGAGYYGADWSGPEIGLDGAQVWRDNVIYPEDMQTSGSSIGVIIAAAMATGVTSATDTLVRRGEFDDVTLKLAQSYANLDSSYTQLFRGAVSSGDGNNYITIDGAGQPSWNVDNNDYVKYNRSLNKWIWGVGGSTIAQLDATSGLILSSKLLATYVQAGDASYYMTLLSSNPLVNYDNTDYSYYDRATDRYHWAIGNADVATLDAVGGLVLTGKLIASFVQATDASYYMTVSAGTAILNFDTNDALSYIRSSNTFNLGIGGSTIFTATSALFRSNVAFTANAGLTINGGTTANGAIAATGDVSGANVRVNGSGVVQAGDGNSYLALSGTNVIWNVDNTDYVKFNRSTNAWGFFVGNVCVASIDASGNMVLRGTLTQSGSPSV